MNSLLKNVFAVSLLLLGFQAVADQYVYIPLGSGNQVIKVDAKTDEILASYSDVENAHGLVATPDGEYLIAGSLTEQPLKKGQPKETKNSQLFFIHPAHGHVMSTIAVAGWTHHQAITPDGRYVLSTHGMRGYISVVDVEDNVVVKNINTGKTPNYTIITNDGKFAYVSNSGSNSISEVDLKSLTVSRTLGSGPAPAHLVFSHDQQLIYVANPRAGKISIVSVSTGKVTGEYEVGKKVHGLDLGDDKSTLFVSTIKGNKLVSIDTKTGNKKELSLKPAPYHLNTITGTGKVYVSSKKQSLIWVVDQKTLTLINTIKLPAGEGHQMVVVNE